MRWNFAEGRRVEKQNKIYYVSVKEDLSGKTKLLLESVAVKAVQCSLLFILLGNFCKVEAYFIYFLIFVADDAWVFSHHYFNI